MKRMNRFKLVLDLIMLIALVLLYNKNVLGLSYHEIAGIAVCGLFIIHILLNGKWVLVITGKLFSPKIVWRNKLNWLVDFLLLLCFAYILISGVFISKVLFTGQHGPSVMKTGHYAVSALALALIGIHLGLHYAYVIQRLHLNKLPLLLRRITAVALSVVILGFGVYEMSATSFLHWLGNLGSIIGTETIASAEDEAHQAVLQDGSVSLDAAEANVLSESNGRGRGNGNGQGNGKGNIAQADPSLLGTVLLGFLSITLSFSVITAWLDGSTRRRKRRVCYA